MPQSECVRRAYQSQFEPVLSAVIAAQSGDSPSERDRIQGELRRLAEEVVLARPWEGASVSDGLTELARSQELVLQPVLDSIVIELDEYCRRLRLPSPGQTFVGLLPTGDFNARTAVLDCGVLIAVNSGLLMLLHLIVKALTSAIRFSDVGPDGELVEDAFAGPPAMTLDEIRSIVATAVAAYLLLGDAALSRRVATQTGLRSELASRVLRACEVFAVAHELGHALCGHLMGADQRPLALLDEGRQTVGSVEVASRDWRQEFEADDMATRIMLAHEDIAVVGPVFAMGSAVFFATDMLVSHVRREFLRNINLGIEGDHPPSDARWAEVRATHARSMGSDHLEVADMCVDWILSMDEFVVAELTRVV